MGWYEERFTENSKRVACACISCGRAFWLPSCEVPRRKTCGEACGAAVKAKRVADRARPCVHCGEFFTPRSTQVETGQGHYCSTRCSTYGKRQLWNEPARARAAETLQASINAGRFVPRKGESHPQWKGGPIAYRRRVQASGLAALRLREYRRRNPHKAREFAASRRRRKHGRLPRGTVAKIGKAQRWKCACCRIDIRAGYHLDHITPLARGGKHEPLNLQLLCGPCNVRKGAKDPIEFMQSRGFLL